MQIHTHDSPTKTIKNPVLTIGTFDGVHSGHKVIIERLNQIASEIGGESVLLTFDPHPRTIVNAPGSISMLTTLSERFELLEKAGLQHVIVQPFTRDFSRLSATEFIRDILVNSIGVAWVVVGYDHRFGSNREGDINLLKELSELYEFKVDEIDAQTIDNVSISSTKIRQAIDAGQVDLAAEYLGHQYSFEGTVVRGEGRGKGLGFPTANVMMTDQKIVPGIGVYAVRCNMEGKNYDGMMNVGVRPTFAKDSEQAVHIEVHLHGLEEEIYGMKIRIHLYHRIRDEKKFNSEEELKEQLSRDREESLRRLQQDPH